MAISGNKEEGAMSELVARTGRLQQRYEHGCRLVAGCIPFRYRSSSGSDGSSENKIMEVLMINSNSGRGLLFPKGGWENDETVEEAAVREAMEEAGVKGEILGKLGLYDFKSKTLQDENCPEGLCKAEMFALLVKEELQSWPEQNTRRRTWLAIPEALNSCRHEWMHKALEEGFMKWYANHMADDAANKEGESVIDLASP
ncbi:Nudix hydrolase 16, mitochondrial [Dionaea muscipula]